MTDNLKQLGHISIKLKLPEIWKELSLKKDYEQLDTLAKTSLLSDGLLYLQMKKMAPEHFLKERSFEHILSLREGPQREDFDGIWHDDGTRFLAFSMSLNEDYKSIMGGELLMRHKSSREKIQAISARAFGTLTVFATGQDEWEHKTNLVLSGSRLVLAGWLS